MRLTMCIYSNGFCVRDYLREGGCCADTETKGAVLTPTAPSAWVPIMMSGMGV